MDLEGAAFAEGEAQGAADACSEALVYYDGLDTGFMKGYALGIEIGFYESIVSLSVVQQAQEEAAAQIKLLLGADKDEGVEGEDVSMLASATAVVQGEFEPKNVFETLAREHYEAEADVSVDARRREEGQSDNANGATRSAANVATVTTTATTTTTTTTATPTTTTTTTAARQRDLKTKRLQTLLKKVAAVPKHNDHEFDFENHLLELRATYKAFAHPAGLFLIKSIGAPNAQYQPQSQSVSSSHVSSRSDSANLGW